MALPNAGNGDGEVPGEGGGPDDPHTATGTGPGGEMAGVPAIVLAISYLILVSLLVLFTLMTVWPQPTPAMSHAEGPRVVTGNATSPTDSAQAPAGAAPEGAVPAGAASAAQPPVGAGAAGPATQQAPQGEEEHRPMTIPGPGVVGVPGMFRCQPPTEPVVWTLHANDTLDPQCVRILFWIVPLFNEQRLLLIVLLAGALGSLVHGLRSLTWYVGTRTLKRSWLALYYPLPVIGAVMALVLYAIIRGGFFSSTAEVRETSPFGFAGAAFLVGLFTDQAIEKFKEIARSLFGPKPQGPETAPQPTTAAGPSGAPGEGGTGNGAGGASPAPAAPVVTGASLRLASAGDPENVVEIVGTGFTSEVTLEVNGEMRKPTYIGPTGLLLPLTEQDLRVLETGGQLTLVAVAPGPNGPRSAPHSVQQ